MSKRRTNLLGIVIAIIAGTYFNIMLCNNCSSETVDTASIETTEAIDKYNKGDEKKHEQNPN